VAAFIAGSVVNNFDGGGGTFYGVCAALRADEFLRGYSDH
jgi:hypothetical protein